MMGWATERCLRESREGDGLFDRIRMVDVGGRGGQEEERDQKERKRRCRNNTTDLDSVEKSYSIVWATSTDLGQRLRLTTP